MLPFALAVLASCSSGGFDLAQAPLTLEVTSPEYGIYTGSDVARVTGVVFPANAVVTVENREVVVGSDGSFDVEVPIAGHYRNLDIRAYYFEENLHERIPVFSSVHPLEKWPGGIGMRVTPHMLNGIAEQIAVGIDEGGWQQGLIDGFTPIETEGFTLVASDVRNRDAEVWLTPSPEGLELTIRIRDIVVELDMSIQAGDTLVEVPTDVGYDELLITAQLAIEIDSDGMLVLGIGDAGFSIGAPITQLGPWEGDFLDPVLQGAADLVNGIATFGIDLLLGQVADIPIGGPFDFEIDLIGTPLAVSLAGLGTDSEGVFIDLGLAVGEPIPDPLVLHRPTLDDGGPQADLIVAMHEGLFSPLIESDLLDLLEQDLELGGILGAGLGVVFLNLPGGDSAPAADAWCVRVTPGSARSARMNPDLEHMITMYMPDLQMEIGITHDEIDCDPWLSASLAVEASFAVDGTALDLAIEVPDGNLSFYGATSEYDDLEVVQGLGGLFDILFGLLGGSLGFDLGDLLGGGAPPVPGAPEPQILGIYPIEGPDGEPIEGLYALGIDIL